MGRKSLIKLVTGSNNDEVEDEEMEIDEEEDYNEEKVKSMDKKSTPQEDWMDSEGQLTLDVFQTGDEIVIKSTIAGVKSGDLDITITNDMVTIKGKRHQEESVNAEDYYYQELYWGNFSRSVILPQEVDTESTKAALKDGVLTIRLPKLERSKSKKVKIQSS